MFGPDSESCLTVDAFCAFAVPPAILPRALEVGPVEEDFSEEAAGLSLDELAFLDAAESLVVPVMPYAPANPVLFASYWIHLASVIVSATPLMLDVLQVHQLARRLSVVLRAEIKRTQLLLPHSSVQIQGQFPLAQQFV